MTGLPEEFDSLAEELRRRVAADFRSEAEEVERLVQLQRRRKATLRDIATAAMHQGQEVRLRGSGEEWVGELMAVGSDYLSLKTATQILEAKLDSIVIGLVPARQGGRTGKPASETFKARLAEFESTGEEVTVRSRQPVIEVTGVIEVVAADHIEMNCPAERCYLPIDGVFMVIRPLSE
jgi:hypothetical protein